LRGGAPGRDSIGRVSIKTTSLRIKATLKDVAPEVTRWIAVPLAIRLDRLHLVLQAAFGWTNTHLYLFDAAGGRWGEPDPDGFNDDIGDASKTRLYDIVRDTGAKTIHYIYDFGDNWDHVIKIEKWIENSGTEGLPFLIDAKGRCPPEDVGGPPGYGAFLAAMADPAHPEHAAMRTWIGGDFNPAVFNRKVRTDDVDALAEKWKPRRRKP
jgi:hypothetical protein